MSNRNQNPFGNQKNWSQQINTKMKTIWYNDWTGVLAFFYLSVLFQYSLDILTLKHKTCDHDYLSYEAVILLVSVQRT